MSKTSVMLFAFACMHVGIMYAPAQDVVTFALTDEFEANNAQLPRLSLSEDQDFVQWTFFQEQPVRVAPQRMLAGTELPTAALEFDFDLFGHPSGLPGSLFSFAGHRQPLPFSANVVRQSEATVRNAADVADMLRLSPIVVGVGSQIRNPIIHDPRVRASRIGSLGASGSYWVPARMDLDTAMSKIDSRIVSEVTAIKGPFAARYGPGFSHLDFSLLPSPRYEDGVQVHGTTGFDFQTNGERWAGRQRLWGGAADWGFFVSYGHRSGSDYEAGNGMDTAASYKSRDVDVTVGADITPQRHVELNYIRQDQTDVELPGQAFDIDVLCVDGFEISYSSEDSQRVDLLEMDAWYNRTRFDGSAQRSSKRDQFPYYDFISFVGNTDVDSMSTGYRLAGTWGCLDCGYLTLGTDLRYIKQELNEITSGQVGLSIWSDANSPVPRSYSANPGLFAECGYQLTEKWSMAGGARFDLVQTDVVDDPNKLASLGSQSRPDLPISLADILGSDDFRQDFALWAVYLTNEYRIHDCWTAEFAVGYAQRPPTLTELYAAETFMFVLQNGLNTLTGDPLLKQEQLLQADLGLQFHGDRLRASITGFYGWAWNYITFENMGVVYGPPYGEMVQEQLKFVNTALATFVGGELYSEWDATEWLTPFATLSYVVGTDRTRNGDFATRQSFPGNPSYRDTSNTRGWYSGIGGGEQEPLPGLVPLDCRLGFRWHQASTAPRWSVETSVRLVDAQQRVATSLLEKPTPGFAVWDIRGYWRATPNLLTIAGIENITDETYREHLNFTSQDGAFQVFQPGVSLYIASELSY